MNKNEVKMFKLEEIYAIQIPNLTKQETLSLIKLLGNRGIAKSRTVTRLFKHLIKLETEETKNNG